jgi:RecA/RadA recombinase
MRMNASIEQVLSSHVTPDVMMRLQHERIRSVSDIIFFDSIELGDILRVTYYTAGRILQVVYNFVAPEAKTAAERLALDQPRPVLRLPGLGGALTLRPGLLTEFCGHAGAGKTQLCFSVAAEVARMGRTVVWIDTEKTFVPARVAQIAAAQNGGQGGGFDVDRFLSRVQVMEAVTLEDLKKCVQSVKTDSADIGCIIIDSLADLARKNRNDENTFDRSKSDNFAFELTALAAELKQIATQRDLIAIATNQIYGGANNSNNSNTRNLSAASKVKAALGDTWYYSVNLRVTLQLVPNSNPPVRTLTLTKAAWSPPTTTHFVVNEAGVALAPENPLIPLQA